MVKGPTGGTMSPRRKKKKSQGSRTRREGRRPTDPASEVGEISGRLIEASVTHHPEPPSPAGPKKIHRRRPLPPVPDDA